MKNHILGAAIALLLSSCISVRVPFEASSKADNIEFQAPGAPFILLEANIADHAWISEKTGNTLSYLSECKTHSDKIEEFALDSVKAIEKAQIQHRGEIEINGKKGYEIIAVGFMDKAHVKMVVTTLRHGNCFVNLSYGGLEKNFSREIDHYQEFKKRFKAP